MSELPTPARLDRVVDERIAPMARRQAKKLLDEVRGRPKLTSQLSGLAQLALSAPQRVGELARKQLERATLDENVRKLWERVKATMEEKNGATAADPTLWDVAASIADPEGRSGNKDLSRSDKRELTERIRQIQRQLVRPWAQSFCTRLQYLLASPEEMNR
ncbi:MAG: hypothetical protein HYV63_07625 [Candidatus Schekmanbacteria bacterium]|nr:hypothetical protein [Candidatus Schekmanbacteria bacterium]